MGIRHKGHDTVRVRAKFTCWKGADGRFRGFLNAHPDHWTQGEDPDDLKELLKDLFKMFTSEDVPGIRKEGELEIA